MEYTYTEKRIVTILSKDVLFLCTKAGLVKLMMVVTTGHILNVFGLYITDGENNDANILNSLMKERSSLLL